LAASSASNNEHLNTGFIALHFDPPVFRVIVEASLIETVVKVQPAVAITEAKLDRAIEGKIDDFFERKRLSYVTDVTYTYVTVVT
jgi:hypothetical protein